MVVGTVVVPTAVYAIEGIRMCGIAGYLDLNGGIDQSLLRSMAREMSHRGPDESGIWIDGSLGLSHARLSILDLATSHQPLVRAEGVIAFNGEIYNYRVLREELESDGDTFVTNGDTEVLLLGVLRYGAAFLDRCEGMFAAAIWERSSNVLRLVRDRFGKKPLYISNPREGLFVFGSEPKVLLVHPEVADELDESALRSMVLHRAVYDGRSAFKAIRQLAPGGVFAVDPDGQGREDSWYSLPDAMRSRKKEGVRDTGAIVLESIRHRMVSDVPVGAFLSGGIDSSIVVAGMRRLDPDSQIRTFSVSFEGDSNDEYQHAKFVADKCRAIHERVIVGVDDFMANMAYYSRIRDAPLSEPADVAVGLMSRRAKQDVKVVLSGEGADEAFGGYPKYRFATLSPLMIGLARLIPNIAIGTALRVMGSRSRRLRIAIEAIRQPTEVARLCRWFAGIDQKAAMHLFPKLLEGGMATSFAAQAEALGALDGLGFDAMQRMQLVDFATWLPGNLLERGDRLTMAEGLEARMPFMSESVILHGLGMSPTEKASRRETKLPLRRLADSWIGPEISKRPKWGFRVPLREWFSGKLGDRLDCRIQEPASFVQQFGEVNRVMDLLASHRSGAADHQMSLWTVLALEEWYQSRTSSAASLSRTS